MKLSTKLGQNLQICKRTEKSHSDSSAIFDKIPKIIHQAFQTRFLPEDIVIAAHSWINKNHNYEYRYSDRREFIKICF